MDSNTGKYMIVFGAMIVLVGIIVYFFHDKLHWIGRLPGDIRIEKRAFPVLFPPYDHDPFQFDSDRTGQSH